MKVVICPALGALLSLVLIGGCQKYNGEHHHLRNKSMDGLPPWSYAGPYNVNHIELSDPSVDCWNTHVDLPKLTEDEHQSVADAIRLILKQFGEVDPLEFKSDFYVWDDNYFDRTVRVEYYPSPRLPRQLPKVVSNIQRELSNYPLWRVFLVSDCPQDCICIYPSQVLTRRVSSKSALETELVNIAQRVNARPEEE